MKRFIKLYKLAKAYHAKKPFKLACKMWFRGDNFVYDY